MNLGLSITGNRDQLIIRIKKFERNPKLVERIRVQAMRNFTFSCSFDPEDPIIICSLDNNNNLLPKSATATLEKYTCLKKEGSQVQMEKSTECFKAKQLWL